MDSRSHYNIPLPAQPYYECVFCKRGFNNPQALGGHMNIHRKDRGKPANPRNNAPAVVSVHERPVIYVRGFYNNPYYANQAAHDPGMSGCSRCFPDQPLASSSAGVYDRPQDMGLFREEEKEGGGQGEVDLELRLGQKPAWWICIGIFLEAAVDSLMCRVCFGFLARVLFRAVFWVNLISSGYVLT